MGGGMVCGATVGIYWSDAGIFWSAAEILAGRVKTFLL